MCQPRCKIKFFKSSIEKHLNHIHKMSIADYEHEFGIPAYDTENQTPQSTPSTAQSQSVLHIMRPGSQTQIVQTSPSVPAFVRMSNDSMSLRPAQSQGPSFSVHSLTQDTSSHPFQSQNQGRSSAWLQVPSFSHAVGQVAPTTTSLSSVTGA